MMKCARCNVELLALERSSSVSAAGLAGALIGVVGLLTLFANALLGVAIIIVGLLLGGLTRRKRTVLVCPRCKSETPIG